MHGLTLFESCAADEGGSETQYPGGPVVNLEFHAGHTLSHRSGKRSQTAADGTLANILEGDVQFFKIADLLKREALNASEAEQLLLRSIGWLENRNLNLSPEDSDLKQDLNLTKYTT